MGDKYISRLIVKRFSIDLQWFFNSFIFRYSLKHSLKMTETWNTIDLKINLPLYDLEGNAMWIIWKFLITALLYVNFRNKCSKLKTCPFPMFPKLRIGYSTVYNLHKDAHLDQLNKKYENSLCTFYHLTTARFKVPSIFQLRDCQSLCQPFARLGR